MNKPMSPEEWLKVNGKVGIGSDDIVHPDNGELRDGIWTNDALKFMQAYHEYLLSFYDVVETNNCCDCKLTYTSYTIGGESCGLTNRSVHYDTIKQTLNEYCPLKDKPIIIKLKETT